MRSEELSSVIQQLSPAIREHAPKGEIERRVPKEVADALRAAGLFKTWIPKALGGWEIEPVVAIRAFEELAQIDSTASWMLQMCSAVSLLGGYFGDEAIAEMHEVGDPVFGDSFAPPMRMVAVDGGWQITGQSSFVSNCHHIDWFFGLGMEFEGDAPKPGPEGAPVARTFAVPRGEFEIVENWNTLGMRGTGSHDVRLNGVFVPERRAVPFHPISKARNGSYSDALIRLGPIWLGITSMSAVGLGIAQAAYDDFLGLCGSKTANYSASKVGESPLTHYRLGEAHANLGAARSFLYGTLADVWSRLLAGEDLSTDDRCNLSSAATFCIQASARALELIGESSGTSMIREGNTLCRHARDLRTLTQHVFTAKNRYQDIGLMLLGRDPAFDMLKF
jgi:alkylation response protein AidB-like acyl-CoA dehydrogenase